MSHNDLAVIVATYNREKPLRDTLKSIRIQLQPSDELIVVDQTDRHESETEADLQELGTAWHRVSPASLPAARNYGLRWTRARVVVFVDDDVLLEPGFLDAHREAHSRWPRAGAVGGRVVIPGELPSDSLAWFDWAGLLRGGFNWPESGPIQSVIGCNMSWKRACLEEIGGFDPRFEGGAQREESDACARARRAGWEVRYEVGPTLVHLVAPTGGVREGSVLDSESFYRNHLLFVRLNGASPVLVWPAAIRTWLAFGVAGRPWSLRRAARRGRATSRGLLAAVRASRRPNDLVLRPRNPPERTDVH